MCAYVCLRWGRRYDSRECSSFNYATRKILFFGGFAKVFREKYVWTWHFHGNGHHPSSVFWQLHKIEGVIEDNCLSRECHVALEQNSKDVLEPLFRVFKCNRSDHLPNLSGFQTGDKKLTLCPLWFPYVQIHTIICENADCNCRDEGRNMKIEQNAQIW